MAAWIAGLASVLSSARADTPPVSDVLAQSPGELVAQNPAEPPVAAGVRPDVSGKTETPASPAAIPPARLQYHVPDPFFDRKLAEDERARAQAANDKSQLITVERVTSRMRTIQRPGEIHLSLQDVVQRTLANSFAIDVTSYNPAIETTRVVEAEAAFDAMFFTSLRKNIVDQPTGSTLASSYLDFFDSRFGVRKVLPTGATVSASYGWQRTETNNQFQQINPEYFNDLVLEARQPLLRNFGLDYNRSLIVVAKNNRQISDQAFARQVRDIIRDVEALYWRLVQARREMVITARLLAEFELIHDQLEARQTFDITPVQLSATRANLENRRADLIRVRAVLFDAEDRLVAAINDPEINLAEHSEIVPTDFPTYEPMIVDRMSAAQTALNHREEIREQELRVTNAKVFSGRTKLEQLPRLDLTLQYTVDGLESSADDAFDQLTQHNYTEYLIGVELEFPIGNRAPRAAHRRAQLEHRQAVAQLKSVFEQVLLDVNLTARDLSTAYDQILPAFISAESREKEVLSVVQRAERKDLNTLNSELAARNGLADARRSIIRAIVDYNIAIIDLERAKGTLLQYNNVVIPSSDERHKR